MNDLIELEKKATELRLKTINAIHKAKTGHTGGSLSVMDILVTLFYGNIENKPIMRIDPKKPGWEDQDYFVLSKGHAAPALYSILADRGFFDPDELNYLHQLNSMLQGHPHQKIPGVPVTSGSHGHGFASAHGLALSLKLDKKSNKVFSVLGDGELQEGIIWETAMSAAHYKLDNLHVFIDNNELQADGFTRSIMNVEPIVEKFESFGWRVVKVRNGHNYEDLLEAVDKVYYASRKPNCIICNTIKGKGVEFAERRTGYHKASLSDQEMSEATKALESRIHTLNSNK